jgi:hypothetical protein
MIRVSYQDQKYPMHTSSIGADFSVPFPEAFDQYLPDSMMFRLQGQSQPLDANIDQIDGMVWPEANSAWYLSNVMQQLSNPASPPPADRNALSGAITAHTINLLAGNWRSGDRTAAVGTNFMYL